MRTIVLMVLASGWIGVGAAANVVPTFSKDVAPILFKNCIHCHRPGEIASNAPFLSYESARPWAKAIKQKVLTREMPPWSADPNRSLRFRNDPRLSQLDIRTLVAWVDAGAPKGNETDLPPVPTPEHGWLHPKGLAPDLVVGATEFKLPAKGDIPYVKYMLKVPLTEDRWIAASQARPGNSAVVHHMAITEVSLADGLTPENLGPLTELLRQTGSTNQLEAPRSAVTAPSDPSVYDMLGVYTPGSTFEMYPSDSGKLLKAGKNLYIDFNIHYEATGKPEKDQSMVAFWFLPRPPKYQMFRVSGAGGTIIANGSELLADAPGKKAEGAGAAIPPIPPYADNYELIGILAFRQSVTIYQFQPHAHRRAKDFQYTVVYPDGHEQTLLTIPKYDVRWQLAYELEQPLKLPPGSKLVITAHYDNSVNNKDNPGPEKQVYFRDSQNQSWDEMFTPFIQYSMDTQAAASPTDVVGVAGCLERDPQGEWTLTDAGDPQITRTQSTSSADLKAAEVAPLGNRKYSLLGVGVFHPVNHQGQRVAAKGILIPGDEKNRLNVTSLQTVAAGCVARAAK